MKNLLTTLLLIALYFLTPFAVLGRTTVAVPDSLQLRALDAKLTEYFQAMEREDFEVQKAECDFIISSAQNPELRQIIAEKVYDHYLESKRMGSEAVAIHVFDTWFASGKASMSDEIKQLNAKIYAEFNRQSLLGCVAPELKMQTMKGDSLVIPSKDNRYKILYFYDVDCTKCKVQSMLIRNLLDGEDYPLDFYAIYAGDNKSAWESYVADQLELISPRTKVTHLWDSTLESDFQRKYGVIQTPRLFWVAPNGRILGRGLDARALSIMLKDIYEEKQLTYGTAASEKLYSILFDNMGGAPTARDVSGLADHIAATTLNKADTVMFRQMAGDLMYYLTKQTEGGYREGLYYLTKNYILSRPDIWRTQDDSLKVVGMAQMMGDLLSRATFGTKIPSVEVPGELITSKKAKKVTLSLSKLKKHYNIIIFYLPSCANCKKEIEAAKALLAGNSNDAKRTSVFLINMDEIYSSYPDLAQKLLDSYDLSVLPNIYITDKSGNVINRYVSLL